MNKHYYQAPAFDMLEIDLEPELLNNIQETLEPVAAGATVAGLTTLRRVNKWHPYFDEIVLDTTANFLRYTHKPLLLYFFEKEWGSIAKNHLRQLNAAHKKLQKYSVNLLVVTSTSYEEFKSLAIKEIWSLEAYEDPNKELASVLKIYSEKAPSWSRYPGIEGNVPLPALYLIGSDRQIIFDFPNKAIQGKLPLDEILQMFPYVEGYAKNTSF